MHREVRVEPFEIQTPVAPTTGLRMAQPRPVVVPILRAGLGMLEGMTRLLPTAEIGFLGMIRDFLVALVLAAVFAGLLHPAYVRLCALLRGRDLLAAVLTLIVALLAVGVPLAGVVGMVVAEAVQVSEQVRPWVKELLASDLPLSGHLPDWIPFADFLDPYREDILGRFADAASAMGSWLVSSASAFTQGTVGFLLSPSVWAGIVVCGLFVTAAIYVRRYRDES